MFEDEDDILVCCQVPDCSLRSADYEIPGVFHGRCAAALGHSGGARFQNCPWCPPPAAVISFKGDVVGSEEEKYFISMTQAEEDNFAAWIIQRGWRWTRKRIGIRVAWEKKLQEKLREARRQEKGGDSQGDAIHLEGRGERIEKAAAVRSEELARRMQQPNTKNMQAPSNVWCDS